MLREHTRAQRGVTWTVRILRPTVPGRTIRTPTARIRFSILGQQSFRLFRTHLPIEKQNRQARKGPSAVEAFPSPSQRAPSQGLCCTSHNLRRSNRQSGTRIDPWTSIEHRVSAYVLVEPTGKSEHQKSLVGIRSTAGRRISVGEAEVDWPTNLRLQGTMGTVV
nr:uncharacterized protein LOC109408820 [Aedes albopictus]